MISHHPAQTITCRQKQASTNREWSHHNVSDKPNHRSSACNSTYHLSIYPLSSNIYKKIYTPYYPTSHLTRSIAQFFITTKQRIGLVSSKTNLHPPSNGMSILLYGPHHTRLGTTVRLSNSSTTTNPTPNHCHYSKYNFTPRVARIWPSVGTLTTSYTISPTIWKYLSMTPPPPPPHPSFTLIAVCLCLHV